MSKPKDNQKMLQNTKDLFSILFKLIQKLFPFLESKLTKTKKIIRQKTL